MTEEVSHGDILVAIERLAGQVALVNQRVEQVSKDVVRTDAEHRAAEAEIEAIKAKLFDAMIEGAERKGFFRGMGIGAKSALIIVGALGGSIGGEVIKKLWALVSSAWQ